MNSNKISQEELENKLKNHILWLRSKGEKGIKAKFNTMDLSQVDFCGADLRKAMFNRTNLAYSNFSEADLRGAEFEWAELGHTIFYKANLSGANLSGAWLVNAQLKNAHLVKTNLSRANLVSADLRSANLRKANLQGADLSCACLNNADLEGIKIKDTRFTFNNLPEGELIVYKKVRGNFILKLKIPIKAKRTACLINNKCRAEYAIPIAWRQVGDRKWKTSVQTFISQHDINFKYIIGKKIVANTYNPFIGIDCTGGIHFFTSEFDAEQY